MEPGDYEGLSTAQIFQAFVDIHAAKKEISQETLLEHIGDDEASVDLAHILLMSVPKRDGGEVIDDVLHEAENCVFTLRNMSIANRILEISREAAVAERSGNSELFNQLTYEQLELEKIHRGYL